MAVPLDRWLLETERRKLEARIAEIDAELLHINAQLIPQEKWLDFKMAESDARWTEFVQATASRKMEIYAAGLLHFCADECTRRHLPLGGMIKFGRRWDQLPCRKRVCKVTGDVYGMNTRTKVAQCNVIRWPTLKTSADEPSPFRLAVHSDALYMVPRISLLSVPITPTPQSQP